MYCTVDMVREEAKDLIAEGADDDFTDPKITTFSNDKSVPIIDGALSDLGAPYASAPPLVKLVDSMLTAGAMMKYVWRRNTDKKSVGEKVWDEGMALLDKIQQGVLSLGSDYVRSSVYTVFDDTLPLGSIFVGRDAINWRDKPEVREGDVTTPTD